MKKDAKKNKAAAGNEFLQSLGFPSDFNLADLEKDIKEMKPQFDALAEAQGLTTSTSNPYDSTKDPATNAKDNPKAKPGYGTAAHPASRDKDAKTDKKTSAGSVPGAAGDEFCFDNLLETFQDPEFQSFLTTMLNHNVPEGSGDKKAV